jgi:hypothetical protein
MDWSESHIKVGQLHNKLTTLLNDKKHSEAFSALLELQTETLKLQRYVLYGIDAEGKVSNK